MAIINIIYWIYTINHWGSQTDVFPVMVPSRDKWNSCEQLLPQEGKHRVTYKSRGRSTQVDYILFRWSNLKETGDCKILTGESRARQYQMVVCRKTLRVRKRKKTKSDQRIKWWTQKKDDSLWGIQVKVETGGLWVVVKKYRRAFRGRGW